jgi:hypothetical protein
MDDWQSGVLQVAFVHHRRIPPKLPRMDVAELEPAKRGFSVELARMQR